MTLFLALIVAALYIVVAFATGALLFKFARMEDDDLVGVLSFLWPATIVGMVLVTVTVFVGAGLSFVAHLSIELMKTLGGRKP